MARIAKVMVKDSGEVTITFTTVDEAPTGPLTLPQEVLTVPTTKDQVPDMIRQWLGS